LPSNIFLRLQSQSLPELPDDQEPIDAFALLKNQLKMRQKIQMEAKNEAIKFYFW
jgi:hypothetical protein